MLQGKFYFLEARIGKILSTRCKKSPICSTNETVFLVFVLGGGGTHFDVKIYMERKHSVVPNCRGSIVWYFTWVPSSDGLVANCCCLLEIGY